MWSTPSCEGRRPVPATSAEVVAPPIVNEVLRSPGQPLDPITRGLMESCFRHDFSTVRVHTDGQAADAASAIDARAFTLSRSIVFGAGEFAPQSATGRRLLSHELTHVAQGARAGLRPHAANNPLVVNRADDSAEGEADRVSSQVMRGDFAPRLSSQVGGGVIYRLPTPVSTPRPESPARKDTKPPDSEDGEDQVWSLITPLVGKTYSPPLSAAEKLPSAESKGAPVASFASGLDKYDPAAVKDCFAAVGKLTDEAREYLDSEKGRGLLKALNRLPEGHAGRLFAENWHAPELVMTKALWDANKRLAKLQKHFGPELGEMAHKNLEGATSDEKFGDYIKDGTKAAISAFVKMEEKKIETRLKDDPANYSSKDAVRDKEDLEAVQKMVTGIEDDVLALRPVKWIFEKVRPIVTNPDILEGLLFTFVNPTASRLPGAEGTDSPIGYLSKQKTEQGFSIPLGKKRRRHQAHLKATPFPFVPNDVITGTQLPTAGMIKSLGGDITGHYGAKKGLSITAEDEVTFEPPGTVGSTVSSSKGGLKVDSDNKQTGKTFRGLANYEFKPGVLKMTGSQKFEDGNGSIIFSEGYAVDQDGTKTTFGVDLKRSLITERLKLNFPRNAAHQPVDETGQIGLGAQFPKGAAKDSKTLSLDADITMHLAGQEFVKALSSFAEYKDPKQFLDIAFSYHRGRSGQISTDDFALALKKTWHDVSISLGGSFGMNDGKPVRGNALAGAEIKFGSKSKYGIFAEAEVSQAGLPGSRDIYTGSAGILRDNVRFGGYYSNNPANQFGFTAHATFDAAAFVKRLQNK
jgi:hypothetical protein